MAWRAKPSLGVGVSPEALAQGDRRYQQTSPEKPAFGLRRAGHPLVDCRARAIASAGVSREADLRTIKIAAFMRAD